MTRVLHAGLHKTGSSFFQKRFFPYLPGVCYLGSFSLKNKYRPINKEDVLLFSNEASFGYPYPLAEAFNLDKIKTILEILLVDKLILFTREFNSWVLSLYFQTLNEGHCWSLEEFVRINEVNLLTWRALDDELYDWCKREGIECLFIKFEEFQSDPQRVCDYISDFVGVERIAVPSVRVNCSRYGRLTIVVYRFMNLLCRPRLISGALRHLHLTPRNFMDGKLGSVLERISANRYSATDVEALLK